MPEKEVAVPCYGVVLESDGMKQYIITKNLRDIIIYHLENEGYTDLKWRIKKETESNPYDPQAEREKVLDKLLQWRREYMKKKRGFAEFLGTETRFIEELCKGKE